MALPKLQKQLRNQMRAVGPCHPTRAIAFRDNWAKLGLALAAIKTARSIRPPLL